MRKFTLIAVAALMAATATFAQGNLRNQLNTRQGMSVNQRVSQKEVRADQRQQMMQGQKAVNAKAPRRAGIEEQPEGTVFELFASYSALYYNWFYGWQDASTTAGKMTLVEGTDGNIYILGLTPNAGLDVYYWVKAEKADGDTIVVRQQPSGYYEDFTGGIHEYEVARISYSYDAETEEEEIRLADDPDIKLLYKGNGVLETTDEMNSADNLPPFFYGSVYWYEAGEGDENPSGYYTNNEYYWALTTTVNTEVYNEPSDAATFEQMIIKYKHVDTFYSEPVTVAFEGNDVFFKLYERAPGWVKGTIDGDKVVVKNQQFMGFDDYYGLYEWAHTATVEIAVDDSNPDDVYSYDLGTIVDEIVFDYDAETKTMSTTGAIYIDGERDRIYYAVYFNQPTFYFFKEVPAVPADPIIDYFWAYEDYYESAELDFTIPTTDVDGNYITGEKLSFKFYVDNEPFVFETSEYGDLEADAEEIPYGTVIDGIGTRYLLIYFQPAQNVGLQTIYRGGGVENRSNIVWYDVNTGEITVEPYDNTVGVKGIVDTASTAAEAYDLQGRRATETQKGLLLKTVVTADGTQKVVKAIRK